MARVATRQSRYQEWVAAYDSPDQSDLERLWSEIEQLERKPLISVVVPVFNTPAQFLAEMVDSVLAQTYPYWELCIADDASSAPHVRETLLKYSRKDSRIRVVFRSTNGHICEASNSALELATGEYVALLDHDDVLPRHALAMVAKYINANPAARLFYSDEDKISADGRRSSPYFKPEWDPELIVQQNFFSHLGVFETQLLRDIGGFRKGLEGSQDHDLLLRGLRVAGDAAVVHIPHVLYHWRTIEGSTAVSVAEKPYAVSASVAAVSDYLATQGIRASVTPPSNAFPFVRVDYEMPVDAPQVHIVISAAENTSALRMCLQSLFGFTSYPNYRVSVVAAAGDFASDLSDVVTGISQERLSVFGRTDDVSIAKMVNDAVVGYDSEYVCLLDQEVEIKDEGWLEQLVRHATRPLAGLAGPALCRPDGRVYAAGLVLTSPATAVPAHTGTGSRDVGYFGQALLTHVVSALPCACVVVARSVFLAAGGLQERQEISFEQSVDLSARVAATGRRNVLVPRTKVVWHAGQSVQASEFPVSAQRDAAVRDGVSFRDRCYNPNLALRHSDASATFDLSFPPRINRFE